MRGETPTGSPRTIAVALHGIEPATFEPCALIRDWLYDHGVERVTLLVIPARDLHPVGERSPEMVDWLRERRMAGDSIAQHGFRHVRPRAGGSPRQLLAAAHGQRGAEFVGLDSEETRRAVHAGWRLLKLAGIEPDGFVAPAYAYTSALRATLSLKFQWWAGLLRVHLAQPRLEADERASSQIGGVAPPPGPAPQRDHLRAARGRRADEPGVSVRSRRSALAGGEHRRFEGLDRRQAGVAQMSQAE